jgi:hypothetical protein
MIKLHLLIPSLFWPDAAFTAIYSDLALPSLENLLAKSTETTATSLEVESWLCNAFNVAKQLDWPVAPITLESDQQSETDTGEIAAGEINGGKINAEGNYWIRADPVHLHIEHDQILLADSRVFKISTDEADRLTGSLNLHFHENAQQIEFLPLQPGRWYLRAPDMVPTQTRLLSEAANKNIRNLLPSGPGEATWRSLFNEIQMLLHEHPVNQAREAQGEVPINATWFWGGGTMPTSIASPYTHVWSNDLLSESLARISGSAHAALPRDANACFQSNVPGRHLAVLDTLHGKAQYGDAYGWRESLKNLEQNWFEPLLRMLKRDTSAEVVFTSVGGGAKPRTFTVRGGDLRKFWRRQKPLSSYNEQPD